MISVFSSFLKWTGRNVMRGSKKKKIERRGGGGVWQLFEFTRGFEVYFLKFYNLIKKKWNFEGYLWFVPSSSFSRSVHECCVVIRPQVQNNFQGWGNLMFNLIFLQFFLISTSLKTFLDPCMNEVSNQQNRKIIEVYLC